MIKILHTLLIINIIAFFYQMEKDQGIDRSNFVKWRFVNQQQIPFGRAWYILGNVHELGAWDLKYAIRMDWNESHKWIKEIDLNIFDQVEYKYIEGSYHSVFDGTRWQEGKNRKLNLQKIREYASQTLTLMSFNIRYDNPQDGNFAWSYRRENCVNMILGSLPSVLGIQEALPSQRDYLKDKLKEHYSYVGIPRDLGRGEEVGIFYLTNRFALNESGFVWYSESRRPGVIGFDCKLPRNFTYLILHDQYTQQSSLIINTHFDNISKLSQSKSVEITLDTIENLMKEDRKYRKKHISNIFIMGDFNVKETDAIFNKFYNNQSYPFKSCRATAQFSDKSTTFHHFLGQKFDQIIQIDHIFYYSSDRKATSFKVIKTNLNEEPYLSDHYPVLGEFVKME